MFSAKELIIIVILAAGIGLGASRYFNFKNSAQQSLYSHMGGEFTLDGKDGAVSLSDFKNKNVILYFGFTHCPDVCPLSLSNLGAHFKKLAKSIQDNTQVIFISVDHRRDKPKSVHAYASHFGKSFIGITGNKDAIEGITKKYGVIFSYEEMPESELKYTVNHTSRFFLVNKDGVLIDAVPDTVKFEDFRKKVLSL
jgi:protein SCO1/2